MSWNKLNSKPDSASRAARMGDWGEGVIFNGVVRGWPFKMMQLEKGPKVQQAGPWVRGVPRISRNRRRPVWLEQSKRG